MHGYHLMGESECYCHPEMSITPANVIEVQGLTKHYGDLLAVDHINLEVKSGEMFGFLGPNGAGKTTTVRMLTGVIKADAGSAFIMGYEAGSLKAKQRIGVVPELANAYADLSAWGNLMFMAELYGVPKKQAGQRAGEILENLQLYERRNQPVREFSKGMKQRLLLCMALVNDPQVLFLDEPTSGLDVQSSRFIRGMLRELNQKGRVIFLTTHDMEEANQLCDRIAIINHGKIAALDTPQRLRSTINRLQSIEVSFDHPVAIEALSPLPDVYMVKKMGDKVRLYTHAPENVVVSVVDYARFHNLRIITLNTLAPSLEDAFIELTEKGIGYDH